MQFILLKSGPIIRFNPDYCEFSFNQNGYFVGDVQLHLPQTQRQDERNLTSFFKVESFTFHMDEISCHWVDNE
jgi:hypothetical protein